MRTTITLDDDVAVLIDERRRRERKTFKRIVNEALRAGLTTTSTQQPAKKSYTNPVHMGKMLIDVTSTSQALEEAEGPCWK